MPPSTGPEPVIVAADGTGDVTTIAAGLARAQAGDTVLVRPGTYREQVVIDKDIELRRDEPQGDEPLGQVVIEFDAQSPTVVGPDGEALPNAIRIEASKATVAFLDIRGPLRGLAVQVVGGAPVLDNVSVDLGGDATGPDRYAFHVTDASTASIRYSSLDGGMLIDGAATPSIFSVGLGGPMVIEGQGTDPLVQDSTLDEVRIVDDALPTITGGRIEGTVEISNTGSPLISRNLIEGGGTNRAGIVMRGANPIIRGNRIRSQVTGVDVGASDAPTIEANSIEDNATGIAIAGSANDIREDLVIQNNRFCGNTTNLRATEGSTLTLDGNDVCGEGAAGSNS